MTFTEFLMKHAQDADLHASGFGKIGEDLRALLEAEKKIILATEKGRVRPLLKKCEEIVDDDLENRPSRHSLGRLHAELTMEI